MLERLLRGFAVVASLFVLAGLTVFVVAEARSASATTATELEGRQAARTVDPAPEQERVRERAHGAAREFVDDVNDVLLAPFAAASDQASSIWVRRTVPALIALLVYGLGVGFLARFAAGR